MSTNLGQGYKIKTLKEICNIAEHNYIIYRIHGRRVKNEIVL